MTNGCCRRLQNLAAAVANEMNAAADQATAA